MRTALALATAVIAAIALPPVAARGGAADSLDGWDLDSDENGIAVYRPASSNGDVITVRGQAVLDAKLSDIYEVLRDNKRAAAWMPLIAERRDLETLSATSRLEYTHLAMPWPVTDRYYINIAQAEPLPQGGLRLFVKSVDKPAPKYLEADKILGFLHLSEFILTPAAGGHKTVIKLEVKTDPRGMLPTVLVNAGQKRWPRQFLEGLIDQLKQRGQYGDQAATPLAH